MRLERAGVPAIAVAIALAIFCIDTFTPLDGAIAVLQIAVILIIAPRGRRVVLIGGGGCAGLTLASFAIAHGGGTSDGALSRLLVSLIAQGVTVVLSLRDRSSRLTLTEQARILELSHDTVIIRDRADRIVHWNRGAEALYGWTRAEALGHRCDELLRSRGRAGDWAADGRWAGQIERTRRDGRRLTLASHWLQRTDPDGRPIGIIESSSDLTEQIRLEASRAASERRFREIFDSAGFAMWEADWSAALGQLIAAAAPATGIHGWLRGNEDMVCAACAAMTVVRANPATAELFGADTALRIAPWLPDGLPGMAALLASLAEGADRAESETVLLALDGRRIDVVLRVTLLPEGARWSHVLVTAFDVTERNRARARLDALSAELAHAASVATLGQMSAAIVHEVNQPLTAIINYANSTRRWLNQPQPDMAEVRDCIERIIASGERAAAVIRRVRDMARKTPAQPEHLDVHDVTAQALALIAGEARRGGVRLEQAMPRDLPPVRGDRVQIQQVLVNLAMNAIQALRGRGDGRVVIDAVAADARHLAITVSDNGPGLPTAQIGQVFTPFFSTKPEGMGIGLSICRSLIEAQGGTIVAESSPAQGARFTFTLPRAVPLP